MKIFNNNDARQINVLDERFYTCKETGAYYPSVTTILECYYKGYGFNEWLKQVGYNAEIIAEKAAEQGTNVHNAIDAYLNGVKLSWIDENGRKKFTLREWQMIAKFVYFWEKYKPEILVHEFAFCSEKLKYGGTIDLVCKINGENWVIDYKTSNYIHKTYELQIAAYARAWNELNTDSEIQRTGILWLNSATRGEDKKGKTIQGAGWKIEEFNRPYTEAFNLFLHTQAIWNEENPNYRPKTLIYPMEFQINV